MTLAIHLFRTTAIVAALVLVVTLIFCFARSKGALGVKTYASMVTIAAVVVGAAWFITSPRAGALWVFAPAAIALPAAVRFVATDRKGAAVSVFVIAFVVTFLGGAIGVGSVM